MSRLDAAVSSTPIASAVPCYCGCVRVFGDVEDNTCRALVCSHDGMMSNDCPAEVSGLLLRLVKVDRSAKKFADIPIGNIPCSAFVCMRRRVDCGKSLSVSTNEMRGRH